MNVRLPFPSHASPLPHLASPRPPVFSSPAPVQAADVHILNSNGRTAYQMAMMGHGIPEGGQRCDNRLSAELISAAGGGTIGLGMPLLAGLATPPPSPPRVTASASRSSCWREDGIVASDHRASPGRSPEDGPGLHPSPDQTQWFEIVCPPGAEAGETLVLRSPTGVSCEIVLPAAPGALLNVHVGLRSDMVQALHSFTVKTSLGEQHGGGHRGQSDTACDSAAALPSTPAPSPLPSSVRPPSVPHPVSVPRPTRNGIQIGTPAGTHTRRNRIQVGACGVAVAQGEVHREGRIAIIGQGGYSGADALPDHVRYLEAEQPGPVLLQPAPEHLAHMTRLRDELVGRAGMSRADAAKLSLALVVRGVVPLDEALRTAAGNVSEQARAADRVEQAVGVVTAE